MKNEGKSVAGKGPESALEKLSLIWYPCDIGTPEWLFKERLSVSCRPHSFLLKIGYEDYTRRRNYRRIRFGSCRLAAWIFSFLHLSKRRGKTLGRGSGGILLCLMLIRMSIGSLWLREEGC